MKRQESAHGLRLTGQPSVSEHAGARSPRDSASLERIRLIEAMLASLDRTRFEGGESLRRWVTAVPRWTLCTFERRARRDRARPLTLELAAALISRYSRPSEVQEPRELQAVVRNALEEFRGRVPTLSFRVLLLFRWPLPHGDRQPARSECGECEWPPPPGQGIVRQTPQAPPGRGIDRWLNDGRRFRSGRGADARTDQGPSTDHVAKDQARNAYPEPVSGWPDNASHSINSTALSGRPIACPAVL